MTRFARTSRVFYVEEPVDDAQPTATWQLRQDHGVTVAVPHLPLGLSGGARRMAQRALIDDLMTRERIDRVVLWYYTPAALAFTSHLEPLAVVYDCMDPLAAFAGTPPEMPEFEQRLLSRADVVFTGGYSLYEAKRRHHANIYAMPSGVDVQHFATARRPEVDPLDQSSVRSPRLGFAGVLDERLDRALLTGLAAARPEYQFVLIGPVANIDVADLPVAPNICYLGSKTYDELPRYLAGWDAALLLFALNDATRDMSPTTTPEYLAAGKPVVSTPIADVVRTYGARDLVRIASGVDAFARACDAALAESPAARRVRADAFLRDQSWERIWGHMAALMHQVIGHRPVAVDATLSRRGAGLTSDDAMVLSVARTSAP